MINTKQRAYLKGLAHDLRGTFQIGKNGLTPEINEAVSSYLEANELVKISVLNTCETDINELAEMMASRTRSEVVQIIGKKIVLYRESKTKKRIELP